MRKETKSFRATLSQEFRVLIEAEEDAPADSVRRITVTTPASPVVSLVVTPYLQQTNGEPVVVNTPRDLGLNSRFRAPQLAPSTTTHFEIAPHQSIIAAADIGFASPSIIVEYL